MQAGEETDLERENRLLRAKLAENEAKLATLQGSDDENEGNSNQQNQSRSRSESFGQTAAMQKERSDRMKETMKRNPWQGGYQRPQPKGLTKKAPSNLYPEKKNPHQRAHKQAMDRARQLDNTAGGKIKDMISREVNKLPTDEADREFMIKEARLMDRMARRKHLAKPGQADMTDAGDGDEDKMNLSDEERLQMLEMLQGLGSLVSQCTDTATVSDVDEASAALVSMLQQPATD